MLLMDSEEGETDNSSRNSCHQISYVFDALRRQEDRPYNDGSEKGNQDSRDISIIRQMYKLVKMSSDKCAEPKKEDMSDLDETQDTENVFPDS